MTEMTTPQLDEQPNDSGLSRRDLFRTAGLVAGGAMLLGLPKFVGGLSTEAQAAERPSFSAGALFLELDGQPAGLIRSVEGGAAFASVLAQAPGPDGIPRKRPGPVQFEDIVIQVPLGDESKPLADWIIEALTNTPALRNGAIAYTDVNFNEVKRLEFFNTLLTEVALPVADAREKTPASLTLRLTPQSIRLTGGSGKPVKASVGTKSIPVLAGNFRFNVQGLENACGRISKVESITAKRAVLRAETGQFRDSQKQSVTPFDYSNVGIFLPENDSGPFYAWFDEMVLKGKADAERAGLLEWLDPTFKTVLASVQLGGLGIIRYAPEPVKPGSAERTGLVRVEVYCETFKLAL